MRKTYKTKHPTIKEISIGDKFVCNNGEIVELIQMDEKDLIVPFLFNNYYWYSLNLKFWKEQNNNYDDPKDIKQKLPSLKDKLDLL